MASKTSYVLGNTKEHWTEIKSADLRFGASIHRNSVFFYDAWNSGAAGVRAHGNYRDLHTRRPIAREAWVGGISNSWNRDGAGRERRNLGARAESFPRLLAASGRNGKGARRRLVPHGRSRRSGRGRLLAHHWTPEESDHPEFGPQYSSGTD